jgi:hypothetical protein
LSFRAPLLVLFIPVILGFREHWRLLETKTSRRGSVSRILPMARPASARGTASTMPRFRAKPWTNQRQRALWIRIYQPRSAFVPNTVCRRLDRQCRGPTFPRATRAAERIGESSRPEYRFFAIRADQRDTGLPDDKQDPVYGAIHGSPTFGYIVNAAAPRLVQIAAKFLF